MLFFLAKQLKALLKILLFWTCLVICFFWVVFSPLLAKKLFFLTNFFFFLSRVHFPVDVEYHNGIKIVSSFLLFFEMYAFIIHSFSLIREFCKKSINSFDFSILFMHFL